MKMSLGLLMLSKDLPDLLAVQKRRNAARLDSDPVFEGFEHLTGLVTRLVERTGGSEGRG